MQKYTCCWLVVLCTVLLLVTEDGFSTNHEEFQINVIRPKYFVKKSRTELGVDLAAVINQTFIYTYLISGTIVYHLTDSWGVGVTGAYGLTVDKSDRRVLQDKFGITVDIFTTEWITEASVLWTPVYGKYQLASGRLVYFDTYISAGMGMMGILIQEKKNDKQAKVDDPFACYSPVIGAGQRFYLNKKTSLRWQVRNHMILYNNKRCAPAAPEDGETTHRWFHSIVTQVGISYFI